MIPRKRPPTAGGVRVPGLDIPGGSIATGGSVLGISCSGSVSSYHTNSHSDERPGGGRIDFDVQNGFDLRLDDLTFERFRDTITGRLPAHIDAVADVVSHTGNVLQQTNENYVDPQPPMLDALADVTLPPRISKPVQSAEKQRIEERRLRDHCAAIKERQEEIHQRLNLNAQTPVHGWRRVELVLKFPILFGEGNHLLAGRPQCLPVPEKEPIRYCPRFEKGIYDDVYFILALLQLATNRTALSNLFVSLEYRSVGLYVLQFFQTVDLLHPTSGWQCVTIDDQIPCNGLMQPIFARTRDRFESWGMLAEKAYAKFLGSCVNLHRGDHTRAMQHLTGGVTHLHTWYPEHIDSDNQSILWWRLKENYSQGLFSSVMRRETGLTTTTSGADVDEEQKSLHYDETGEYMEWNEGSAMILQAIELSTKVANDIVRDLDSMERYLEPIKLLKIRQAYGTHPWTGDWSEESHLWNPRVREYLDHTQIDEQITWMRIEDFVRYYNTLATTQNFPGSPFVFYDSLEPCKEGLVALNADQFFITIGDPRQAEDDKRTISVSIGLSQPDKDSIYQNYRDGADLPEVMELRLFRAEEKALQQCYNDNEGEYDVIPDDDSDDDVYVDERVPKPPNYLWPVKDLMPVREVPSGSRFVQQQNAELSQGTYVAVVQQAHFADGVSYCFSVKTSDPNQTGFKVTVESIGTLNAPRIRK